MSTQALNETEDKGHQAAHAFADDLWRDVSTVIKATRPLVDILVVARKLNAVVAEPCIGMGRLQTYNEANNRLSQEV